jgi:hypothetical protein
MTPKESQIDFFSWLIKNKLDEFVMKNKSEIKETLDLARSSFLAAIAGALAERTIRREKVNPFASRALSYSLS